MPRLVALALRAAADEIRADLKRGATWADAHIVSSSRANGRAIVTVDSSRGFDSKRHPHRGKSHRPPTTIIAVARAVKRRAAA